MLGVGRLARTTIRRLVDGEQAGDAIILSVSIVRCFPVYNELDPNFY